MSALAFTVPPSNYDTPEAQVGYVADKVMFRGIDATVDADPGDEDRRPIFRDWLDVFAFTADNGRHFPDLVPMLLDEMNAWKRPA